MKFPKQERGLVMNEIEMAEWKEEPLKAELIMMIKTAKLETARSVFDHILELEFTLSRDIDELSRMNAKEAFYLIKKFLIQIYDAET